MTDRTKGWTLIELAIASAILIGLVAIAYLLLVSTTAAYTDSTMQASLQETARSAVEEMARELRVADAATLAITPYRGSDRVRFYVPRTDPQGQQTWDVLAEYRNEPEPSREGRVVRVENGRTRAICHHVKPGGLAFERTGDTLTIGLRLFRKDGGRDYAAEARTSVTLRNRSDK